MAFFKKRNNKQNPKIFWTRPHTQTHTFKLHQNNINTLNLSASWKYAVYLNDFHQRVLRLNRFHSSGGSATPGFFWRCVYGGDRFFKSASIKFTPGLLRNPLLHSEDHLNLPVTHWQKKKNEWMNKFNSISFAWEGHNKLMNITHTLILNPPGWRCWLISTPKWMFPEEKKKEAI